MICVTQGLMCLHDSVIRVIDSCDLQHLVDFATELKESRQNQSKTTAVAIQNKVRKGKGRWNVTGYSKFIGYAKFTSHSKFTQVLQSSQILKWSHIQFQSNRDRFWSILISLRLSWDFFILTAFETSPFTCFCLSVCSSGAPWCAVCSTEGKSSTPTCPP
mgnify:CR=1 FL=1